MVAADAVDALISAANDLTSYAAAKTAYDALTTAQQARVNATNYSAMVVNYTIASIDDIGTVTKSSKSKIDKARALYNGLSSTEQALVTNYSTLTDAETTYSNFTFTNVSVSFVSGSGVTVQTGTNNVTAYNDNGILITCSKVAAQDARGIKFDNNKTFTIKNNSSDDFTFTLTLVGNGGGKQFTYDGKTVSFGTTAVTLEVVIEAGSELTFTSGGGAYLQSFVARG